MKKVILIGSFITLTLILFLTNKEDSNREFFPKNIELCKQLPPKDSIWIFILAGQSNMAGSAKVEPTDTISHSRIISIDSENRWIYAKEPIHFYHDDLKGLGCGLSFGKELLKKIPKNITIAIIPTAFGGTSVGTWLSDTTYYGIKLLSNFRNRVELAKEYGEVKAILWHQGEADAKYNVTKNYTMALSHLFKEFRLIMENDTLPIIMGELGKFAKHKALQDRWDSINIHIKDYQNRDPYTTFITSNKLTDIGDGIHFDSQSQREMGRRYATEYLSQYYTK